MNIVHNKIIHLINSERMKNMSMIDSNTIRNHPSNNSTSKNAYQFSKTKRFPDYNPQCKVAFYLNDSQLSQRKTSFGFGQKVDFTKPTTCSPPSTQYNTKSEFENNKGRGKSFGLSRDHSPDRSYFIPQLYKNPGPSQYNNQKLSQNNLSYTMRPRTIDYIQSKLSNRQSPGPGQYNQINLDPASGRFFVSKFEDGKFAKINPNSERFQTIKQSPGPLSYVGGDNLSNHGKYVLSNHKGAGTRAFSQTARSTFTDQFRKTSSKFPGPGDYQRPSEFGVYGDAKYYKTMNGFQTIQ